MSITYSLDQQLTVLELSGKDALVFINNQIINDFDHNSKQPHYSAICNPKGRILFSLLIWQHQETLYLAVDQSLAEQCSQYLSMRRFRMAVDISQTNQYIPVVPDLNNSQVKDIALSTPSNYEPASNAAFWQLFFRSKLPWITKDTSEQFIPQHLSLDQHHLIEYQKGCYPGQEIIARLHFIGRNKKQLSLVQLTSDDIGRNGEKVTINGNNGQLCSPIIDIDGQLTAQFVKNITAGEHSVD